MKICKVLTTMMFLMVLANSVQAQRRTIAVSQHKDPPIEVVSIELDKQTLLPDVKFNAPDGWTENLRIKVKNVSEEPITRIEMILGIFSLTDPDVAALTAHYSFGKIRVESLAPNDTVVLTHTGTKGDNNVPGAARLSITSVIWNGDDSLKYDGGRILRKEPGREGQPPIYHRIDPPQAKYHYPKGFTPKIIKASTPYLQPTT